MLCITLPSEPIKLLDMIRLITTAIVVFMVFLSQNLFAQEFTGRAVYQSKTLFKDLKMSIDGVDAPPAELEKMHERLNKMNEKIYTLDFNKTESVYAEEQILESGNPNQGFNVYFSGDGKVYKNVKSKVSMIEEEFFGKEFLITDSLRDWKWQLESETKKIGNYTCYKAVSIDKPTPEDWAAYEAQQKKQKEGTTNFITILEPKERMTTVWYTPEIPVSQGPGKFWGLPGLILEASFDDTVILCSKITINPKEKVEIKLPKKGKKVTKKEYDSLTEKQLEKMKDGNGNITIEVRQ